MIIRELHGPSPTDLESLYTLAAGGLRFDLFSPDLLEEKLFRNPRPTDDPTVASSAARFGAGERYTLLAAFADDVLAGFMQVVSRPWQQRGWLGLFATAEDHRRRGVATALMDRALSMLQTDGAKSIEAIGIPGNYFAPGLDPRYTAALCLLEKRGFEKYGDCANLIADLSAPFETEAEESRLASVGVEVRRAARSDDARLDAFFAENFGVEWRFECELALRNDIPALHLALRDDKIIAFSAHSSQNREWGFFGPMGTAPGARNDGCGRVLLWRCLNDLRSDGHTTSIIPWVGPTGFYAKYTPCRVERVYWRYRKIIG